MSSDEEFGSDLLRPLKREPGSVSTVDVPRAGADGERRQRTMRLAGSGATAVVAALGVAGALLVFQPVDRPGPLDTARSASAPPASATPDGPPVPTACVAAALTLPSGRVAKSIVTGADPTGRFVLGRAYPGGERLQVIVWDDGRPNAVDVPGSDQSLMDANSVGTAVGYSFVGRDGERTAAWVYRDGKVTQLAGDNAKAHAVNEAGVIVGQVGGLPALWRTPTSQPTMLALPGSGWTGGATGIDDDGTVVGGLETSGSPARAGYFWTPDGIVGRLPEPTLKEGPASEFTVKDVRNGWAIGWAARDAGRVRYIGAPRWNLRTGAVDTTTFMVLSEAVNRHGWIVGIGTTGAVLVAGGTTVALPGGDDLSGTIPYSVSDDGRTVAGQTRHGEEPRATVWRCR